MPFDHPLRSRRAGFTILETLIAFSILITVLTAVYSTAISITNRTQKIEGARELSELAYAVLAEYSATYPSMANSGQIGDRFAWSVTEAIYPVPQSETLIKARYFEVTVSAWLVTRPDQPKILKSLFTIPAS